MYSLKNGVIIYVLSSIVIWNEEVSMNNIQLFHVFDGHTEVKNDLELQMCLLIC